MPRAAALYRWAEGAEGGAWGCGLLGSGGYTAVHWGVGVSRAECLPTATPTPPPPAPPRSQFTPCILGQQENKEFGGQKNGGPARKWPRGWLQMRGHKLWLPRPRCHPGWRGGEGGRHPLTVCMSPPWSPRIAGSRLITAEASGQFVTKTRTVPLCAVSL